MKDLFASTLWIVFLTRFVADFTLIRYCQKMVFKKSNSKNVSCIQMSFGLINSSLFYLKYLKKVSFSILIVILRKTFLFKCYFEYLKKFFVTNVIIYYNVSFQFSGHHHRGWGESRRSQKDHSLRHRHDEASFF